MADYKLDNTQTHFLWDTRHEPVLTIKSGDTVAIETKEVTNDYLNIDSTTEDLIAMDFDQLYPLTGPIYVEDAEPGDTLAVEILDIKPKDWGWMSTLAGFGLLPERFPDAYLRTFDLTNGEYVEFREDIKAQALDMTKQDLAARRFWREHGSAASAQGRDGLPAHRSGRRAVQLRRRPCGPGRRRSLRDRAGSPGGRAS